jgi:hypothetical protein
VYNNLVYEVSFEIKFFIDPERIFVRNDEGFGALEMAALTNKIPAAKASFITYSQSWL